jgi:hypothetical protein
MLSRPSHLLSFTLTLGVWLSVASCSDPLEPFQPEVTNAIVYDKALVPSLNEPTTAGTSGTWSIQLRLTNYSGTLNFRAQKL